MDAVRKIASDITKLDDTIKAKQAELDAKKAKASMADETNQTIKQMIGLMYDNPEAANLRSQVAQKLKMLVSFVKVYYDGLRKESDGEEDVPRYMWVEFTNGDTAMVMPECAEPYKAKYGEEILLGEA